MSMRSLRFARVGTRCASALLLAVAGAAAATPSPDTTTDKSEAPESTPLPSGGFALDFKIWKPEDHGEPKRLVVEYEWGGSTRTVQAQRQNDRWHAEFPDQPKRQEVAKLHLKYAFELTAADWKKVHAAEDKLLDGILKAIVDAADKDSKAKLAGKKAKSELDKAVKDAQGEVANDSEKEAQTKAGTDAAAHEKALVELGKAQKKLEEAKAQQAALADVPAPKAEFAATFAKNTRELASGEAATTLRSYGSEDEDGVELMLKSLGIEQTNAGWAIQADKREQLASVADTWVRTSSDGVTADINLLAASIPANTDTAGCAVPSGDLKELDAAAAKDLLKKCLDSLTPDPADAAKIADAKAKVEAGREDRAMAVEAVGATSGKKRAYLLARLGERTLYRAELRAERDKQRDALLAGLDTAFEEGGRTEDGATLVEGAAKPRRYDIVTGAVYVTGLNDVVVPSMVAVCGWEGCLDPTEVAWKAKNGWGRAISFDAGIRLKTVDTQDRRQSDKLSFLFGLSFNPLSVFRLSAGLYTFENAQPKPDGTNPWQAMPYVGLTVNVLNAASILGGIGLNNTLGPTTNPVK